MLLIFTSDTHFDSAFTNENADIRNGELIACFRQTVDYAKTIGAKAIVLGGDLFDSPYPSAEIKASVKNIISSHPDLQFIAICGNHDPLYVTSFYSDCPKNFYVFPETITAFELEDVTIYGISEKSTEENKDKWQGFRRDGKFITLSHGTLNPAHLSDSNASLCLLGHIHKSEIYTLQSGAKAIYSGCLAGRGFDECGQKGFYVIDTDDMSYKFINSSAKIYKEYSVDISGTSNTSELLEVLDGIEVSQNEIARAVLTGNISQPYTIDCEKLQGLLSKFCEIKDQSALDIDVMENINENTLEGEFIRILASELNKTKDDVLRQKILDAMKEGILALRRK